MKNYNPSDLRVGQVYHDYKCRDNNHSQDIIILSITEKGVTWKWPNDKSGEETYSEHESFEYDWLCYGMYEYELLPQKADHFISLYEKLK